LSMGTETIVRYPTKLCAGYHKWIAPTVGFSLHTIDDVCDLFRPGGLADAGIGTRTERRAFAVLNKRGRRVMERRGMKGISVVQVKRAKLGSADAGCVLQNGLKDLL